MTSIGSPSPFFLAGKKAYAVERSLRFDDDQSSPTRLTRTVQSGGNAKKFTVSFWVKRSQLGNTSYSNSAGNSGQQIIHTFGAGNRGAIKFTSADKIQFTQGSGSGVSAGNISTNAVFRDVSAWYHILVVADYANSTVADRGKIFVNGVRQEVSTTTNFLDANGKINTNQVHELGFAEYGAGYTGSSWWYNFFCGYMAEFYFIDGQAYDPSYFTETNVTTGQLVPKEYTGSFGTTGWYLNFSDNSGTTATTLGKDSSGNGNNFTPNNFAVSDALKDSPTLNFCTMNSAAKSSNVTLSQGNLGFSCAATNKAASSTFGVSSGKWYWEVRSTDSINGGSSIIGIVDNTFTNENFFASNSDGYGYAATALKYNNSSNSSYGATWTNGDIIGVALDLDAGTLTFYKNNSSQGTAYSSISGTFSPVFSGQNGTTYVVNFGQDSTFTGAISSGGNTDANGKGDFKYAPPSGHKALCSANLPDPTILFPNKHFDTVLYTGDGSSSRTFSNVLQFQPDWIWLKIRSAAYAHLLYDAVRGAGSLKAISSSTAGTEGSPADNSTYGFLSSFDANGFTVTNGSAAGTFTNTSSATYVAWNWNAGNTDSKTYAVKVHNFSGNNRYIFDDFQTEAVTLDLAEGGTYIFNMDDASNASHPFSIGTAANGTVYTSGITYFLDGVSKTYSDYTLGFAAATTRRLHITVPASAPVLYYWCSVHSGMGGQINTNSTLGSSNFDGSLQATVKANTTAGFSIGTYTAQSSGSATVGHGLAIAPDVVITKSRTVTSNWYIYHKDIGQDGWILFTNGAATTSNSAVWNPAPTSSVFTYGSGLVNQGNIVFYAFSEVAGYSKFGSYTGNGSTDGTFVFTGFRPAFILWKPSTQAATNWVMVDNKRDTFNVVDAYLLADVGNNVSGAEGDLDLVDFLSNGFKLRQVSGNNESGQTIIYLAFAESPFKNARAR